MAVTTINERLATSGLKLGDLPRGSGGATQAAVADLVHSAVGGTANGTMVDCTAAYSEAAVEENFKELATKVNAILAALRTAGLINP